MFKISTCDIVIINETQLVHMIVIVIKTKHILSTDVQDIISTYDIVIVLVYVQDIISTYDIVIINETHLVYRCSRYY